MRNEVKIDLGRCFHAVLNQWWIITIVTVTFFAVACIFTNAPSTNMYQADTTVYSVSYTSLDDASQGAAVMTTYANVINSRKVAESALTLLENTSLTATNIQNMISVSAPTSVASSGKPITISAYSTSAETAVNVANAVATAFVNEIQTMTGMDTVQVLDKAQTAVMYSDAEMHKLKVRVIGVVIGFLLPILIIFVKETFSNKVYDTEDASLDGKLEILGVIPDYNNLKRERK